VEDVGVVGLVGDEDELEALDELLYVDLFLEG